MIAACVSASRTDAVNGSEGIAVSKRGAPLRHGVTVGGARQSSRWMP